jgi:hypothetical protein
MFKVLYLGAHVDTTPIRLFPFTFIKSFCFIDQCPNDTLGTWGFTLGPNGQKISHYDRNMWKQFCRNLKRVCDRVTLLEKSESLWLFELEKDKIVTTLHYHINTVFPSENAFLECNMSVSLRREVESCSIVYVSGFFGAIDSLPRNLQLVVVNEPDNDYIKLIQSKNLYCLQRQKKRKTKSTSRN